MNWKLMTLATTSVAALALSVSSAEAAGMMGDVSLGYGNSWTNVEGSLGGPSIEFDSEYPSLFGKGRVNLPYSDTVNIQLDVISRASLDGSLLNDLSGTKADVTESALGAHINYRDEQGLLGVFVGAGRINEIIGAPVYLAGFEGQYFGDSWTLKAQVGYLDTQASLFLQEAGYIRAGGNFYASKKLKLTAELAYIDGQLSFYGTSVDAEEWAWALGAHYWFGSSIPVSAFVEYKGRAVDLSLAPLSGDTDEHTVNAGVTFHFGGDGFQDADRTGASVDLPDLDWYRVLPISGIAL